MGGTGWGGRAWSKTGVDCLVSNSCAQVSGWAGIWITMLIGIAGSIVATYIGQAVGWYQAGQGAGFIMSVLGAILLLFLYRIIKGAAAKA